MILDAIASLMCFMTALSVFIIHVLSNPVKRHWIDLPDYVRRGLFCLGGVMLYRAINLAVLANEYPPTSPGHMNLESFVVTIFLAYVFTAWSVHILRRTFPVRVYDRLKYIEGLALCSRTGSLALLASLGIKVVPPKGSPVSVVNATRLTDGVSQRGLPEDA